MLPRIPNRARVPGLVLSDAARRSFRHHGAQVIVPCHRADGLLTAHRHAHGPDACGVNIGVRLEERHGAPDVLVAIPAEVHRLASAATVAAGVVEQHAVAVTGQHGGMVEDG